MPFLLFIFTTTFCRTEGDLTRTHVLLRLYIGCPISLEPYEQSLIWQIGKNVKREMCCKSCVYSLKRFLTQDELLWRYILYVANSKMLGDVARLA